MFYFNFLLIQFIDKMKGGSVSTILLYWWITAYNDHMTDLPIRLKNFELFLGCCWLIPYPDWVKSFYKIDINIPIFFCIYRFGICEFHFFCRGFYSNIYLEIHSNITGNILVMNKLYVNSFRLNSVPLYYKIESLNHYKVKTNF